MELLKKHYEKILLGLVVLGLAVSAAMLPFIISAKKDRLTKYTTELRERKIKPLPPLDMAVQDAALQRAQGIYVLDLTTKHNTFNPVQWQKDPTGKPIKMTAGDFGASALEVTNIHELYLIISYERFDAGGYYISVERQNAPRPSERVKQGAFVVKNGSKSDAFTLVEAKGPPDNPTELILKAKDSDEPISLSPAKPYKTVDGYSADLRYKTDNHNFPDQRVNSTLVFGPGGQYRYKIVAITQNSVVVSAQSNNKNTTIPFNPPH